MTKEELRVLGIKPPKTKESTPMSGSSALLRRTKKERKAPARPGPKQNKKPTLSATEDKPNSIHDLSNARDTMAGAGQRGAPEEQAKVGESEIQISESAEITSIAGTNGSAHIDTKGQEGRMAKVLIISEGLGNLRDKNYYGPEAIRSAAEVFEGKPMLLDHPSYSQEQDLPERSVKETVGYYKNLVVITLPDGRSACAGELHFDLTQEGLNAYQKAKSSVHYKTEFPNSEEEYVGISINAQGESTPKTMTVDGETMEVNYVTRFVKARSADMVTIPARGGKFVALLESVSGARMKDKEVRMKTVQRLKEAQKALKEAENSDIKDPAQRLVKIAEARKLVDELLSDIEKAAKKQESDMGEESMDKCGKEEGKEDGEEEGTDGKDDGDGDADGDAGDDGAEGTHQVTTTHKATGKAALIAAKAKAKEESMEAHRLAVDALVHASGLNPKYFDKKELGSMSLTECKREIARTKRVHEASAEEIMSKVESIVPAAHMARESGSTTESKRLLNSSIPELPSFGGGQ